jgi:hypothetical protein
VPKRRIALMGIKSKAVIVDVEWTIEKNGCALWGAVK